MFKSRTTERGGEMAEDEVGQAAQNVVLSLHRAIDTGRAATGIDLFTTDAVFQARGDELVGRSAIAAFLAEREARTDRHTVHVVTNATVHRTAADHVEVTAFVLVHVREPDGSYRLERVLDTVHEMQATDSGWLISRRRSRPLHPAPGAAG
jgi:hypothetical protein